MTNSSFSRLERVVELFHRTSYRGAQSGSISASQLHEDVAGSTVPLFRPFISTSQDISWADQAVEPCRFAAAPARNLVAFRRSILWYFVALVIEVRREEPHNDLASDDERRTLGRFRTGRDCRANATSGHSVLAITARSVWCLFRSPLFALFATESWRQVDFT